MSPAAPRRHSSMSPQPRETKNLAELYDLPLLEWSRAVEAIGTGSLGAGTACFLCTVHADGPPHATGIGLAEHDGDLYFTSGPGTGKSRNLARNPACTLALRLEGLDLSLEGDAARVTDADTIDAVVAAYNEGGWPSRRDGDALTAEFSAQSAGPPPWHLFRFTPRVAFGVATAEPSGASRWTF
jgi:hypothetical protein